MKHLNQSLLILISIVMISSCKKDDINSALGSLIVTNAIIDGNSAKLGGYSTVIYNNGFTGFGLTAGNNDLYIYPDGDSSHPYYNNSLSIGIGDIYSLFLTGQSPTIDAVLIKETIPYRADSSFGVRFINLSPDSSSISVNLPSAVNGSEASSLAYKDITDFKSYPALSADSTYTFEIRNAGTKDLITTYVFDKWNPIPRFKNVTLAFAGLFPGVSVIRVNNY